LNARRARPFGDLQPTIPAAETNKAMRTKNQVTTRRTQSKTAKRGTRALTLKRLPSGQRRRLVRPHTGYEDFIDLFSKLVATYEDELGAGIDVEAMRTAFDNAASLQPAHAAAVARLTEAQAQVALVGDTEAVQEANGWKEMLLIYGRAQQAARTNTQIEVMIEPFMRFMKTGPRTKKPVTTPPAV
jgi:hypothetical protein